MKKTAGLGIIILAFGAFISLGMPHGLHGVAWPEMRESFALPIDAIGLLLVFSTVGYIFSGFFIGFLMRKVGVGLLLALSVTATSISFFAYSLAPVWWLVCVMAVLSGLGFGAIDAGLNAYLARNHSERLMQWLHASFGIGITAGSLVMTAGITLGVSWRPGYALVAMLQIALAAALFATRHWWTKSENQSHQRSADHPQPVAQTVQEAAPEMTAEASILQSMFHLPSILSMLMFFVYVGVELGLGLWSYSLLTQARGVDEAVAGYITGGYWAMFTAGRILAGSFAGKIKMRRLVLYSIIIAAGGLVLLLLNVSSTVTIVGIALVGFSIAPIFPGMVSSTADRVEARHQNNTIGMQIAGAALGGAIIPGSAGLLARNFGLESIPVFLLIAVGLLLVSFLAIKKRPV